MGYTFTDMPDKSLEGIKKEVQAGLTKMAVYMQTTMGFPFETFQELYQDKIKDDAQATLLYMNFRNQHPNVFNCDLKK